MRCIFDLISLQQNLTSFRLKIALNLLDQSGVIDYPTLTSIRRFSTESMNAKPFTWSTRGAVVWQPAPLNIVSTEPLIEPDQFTETASRLAQLPHQRDSNNCTLWPLPNLKKPYLCSLQSKHGSVEGPGNAGLRSFSLFLSTV